MRKFLFALLGTSLIIFFFQASAQEKMLKLEEVFTNYKIYPTSLKQLQWMGDAETYAWVDKNSIISRKISDNMADTICTLDDINNALDEFEKEKLKRLPGITFLTEKTFLFQQNQHYFVFDLLTKKATIIAEIDEKAENIDIEKGTLKFAYTKKNNLYVVVNDNEIAVTNDANKGIVNGQSVHRNEFGIKKGTFWSPNGNLLAFYRMDETMVTDYPLVDIEQRIATVKNTKYPMAGEKSHHVIVGVFNPATKETVFLKTGEPAEQYLTNISWGPDEKYIYIAVLNRDQNHMKLNQYDVSSGEFVKTLFEETNEKYVEPESPIFFVPGNPSQFIWHSERDGYNHLYLYDTSGKLIKQLTKGTWMVNNFLGFSPDGKVALFKATKESPIQKHIYSVNLKNLNITKISDNSGTHSALISKNCKYIIDFYSSLTVSKKIVLRDAKGKSVRVLHESPDPLADYKLGETSIFTIKSNDGKIDLYCRLIKPADFDPEKKHPVFVYVYGGPHAQMVTDSWLGGSGFFLQYMALKGYVVFTLDNRGSANRGFGFESSIFRNTGTIEVDDQMAGIKYLKSLNYVDTNRIGIDGWSYGGFMTISLMLKNPGIFKVACAGGPVIDWKYYEVMYGERYMDTPQDNPEGYKNANLLNYVNNLEGKLMVIHGTMDPTVVWQNSLDFIKKCVDEGKQVDYFVYPGHKHNIRGMDRLHLWKKIEQYFDENL